MKSFKTLFIFLIIATFSYGYSIYDYLKEKSLTSVYLIDEIKFGIFKVFLVKDNYELKAVLIKDSKVVKELYSVPQITEEKFLKIGTLRVYPDGKIIDTYSIKYPFVIKERNIKDLRIYLKKYSFGGVPKLFVEKNGLEKEVVEFHDIDAVFGKSGVYFSNLKLAEDYQNREFIIYKLVPSEYIYDLEEIFSKKIPLDYTYRYYYCDGDVLVFFYSYKAVGTAYGLIFNPDREKITSSFSIEKWEPQKDRLIGCLNKKLYLKRNNNLQILSFDLKQVKPKLVKAIEKGIKLAKKTIKLDGSIESLYLNEEFFMVITKKSQIKEDKTQYDIFNLYVFDPKFNVLKKEVISEFLDKVIIHDKKIYYIDICLNEIYPEEKQIKCANQPFEYVYPTSIEDVYIIHRRKIPPEFLSKGREGILRIVKENGKVIFEEKISPKDINKRIITPLGIFILKRKVPAEFIDLNGNKKELRESLEFVSDYFFIDSENLYFKDKNHLYIFDKNQKDLKEILSLTFTAENGNLGNCDIWKNKTISCRTNIYDFKGKKFVNLNNQVIKQGCFVKDYFVALGSKKVKFLNTKNSYLEDYFEVDDENLNILCTGDSFILYKLFSNVLEIFTLK